jgi:hypothetical protein
MTKRICKFTFGRESDRRWIEGQLASAIEIAEILHGSARVRLDAGYVMSKDGSQLVLDATTAVGESIAQVLTGLLIRELGEDQFSVERIQREPDAAVFT